MIILMHAQTDIPRYAYSLAEAAGGHSSKCTMIKRSQDRKRDPRPGEGRPSRYLPEYCERVANMCAKGLTDFEIAGALDVQIATLYRWQTEHPAQLSLRTNR